MRDDGPSSGEIRAFFDSVVEESRGVYPRPRHHNDLGLGLRKREGRIVAEIRACMKTRDRYGPEGLRRVGKDAQAAARAYGDFIAETTGRGFSWWCPR